MIDVKDPEWERWLNSRPPIIRELANRFPPGFSFEKEGKTLYIVAYVEDGGIEVSEINPDEDYDNAVNTRSYVCPECLPG